jgi:hypothetical protein
MCRVDHGHCDVCDARVHAAHSVAAGDDRVDVHKLDSIFKPQLIVRARLVNSPDAVAPLIDGADQST